MRGTTRSVVETSTGKLEGHREVEVTAFHAVPYAAPPIGDLRFLAPRPHQGWSGLRDASRPGPGLPQPTSRLEAVMGRVEWPQSEDALTISIWTPDTRASLPVMVWLHGGGYSSGSASWPWYDGQDLAANGQIVVVGVNSRLGALGYMYVPDLDGADRGAANRGLLDQICALEWIRENIARFGGNAERVTVAGQSGGGGAIAAMMSMPAAKRLFKRAILQSPALLPAFPKQEAVAICRRFCSAAGMPLDDLKSLRALPVDRVISAQLQVASGERRLADLRPPFQLVIDGTLIEKDFLDQLRIGAGAGIDVVIGSNHGEMRPAVPDDTTLAQVVERIRPSAGGVAEALVARYAELLGDVPAARLLAAVLTDEYVFRKLRFASDQARTGAMAYVYEFDWAPASSRFGCCHTLELPFVFDNFSAWTGSPMLDGADPHEMAIVGQPIHTAWASFVRGDEPGPAGGPDWPAYEPIGRHAMRFGLPEASVRVIAEGPTGGLWDAIY